MREVLPVAGAVIVACVIVFFFGFRVEAGNAGCGTYVRVELRLGKWSRTWGSGPDKGAP